MAKIIDFLPNRPQKKPLHKAIKGYFRSIKYLIKHLFISYDNEPTKPKLELPTYEKLSEQDAEKYLPHCKEIYESSVERFSAIQNKAQQLLGFISLSSTVIGGLIAFAYKDKTSYSTIEYHLILTLFASVVIFSFLSLLAIYRCIRVKSHYKPFISAIIDFEKVDYNQYKASKCCYDYLDCAIYNEVINDHIADFLRAAQMLFLLSLTLLLFLGCIFLGLMLIQSPNTNGVTKVQLESSTIDELERILIKALRDK
ncbi:hypothetical protein H1S01_19345 [Heliobacterium chlorum]|uniref:Uncharacterized protein n=1 Tax=Heliobacterium chlorum TaxID=2698 RepID=A0ABR7T755_HELCL|nr:hypothetical protein [Heliobacterium chlorum]MBC9786603.1 hypothetical protein [Heliobacterium chlorum]